VASETANRRTNKSFIIVGAVLLRCAVVMRDNIVQREHHQ
jgi:hypothetical protein